MSHIKNIEIKNFKSIRHATIEDCRRVNVFIGYPNVGKSNILEALSIFSYLNTRTKLVSFKNICRFKELIDVFNDGDRQKEAQFIVDGYRFTLSYLSNMSLSLVIADNDIKKRQVQITSAEDLLRQTKGIHNLLQIDFKGEVKVVNVNEHAKYQTPIFKKYQFRENSFDTKSNATVLEPPFGDNLAEVVRHNSQLRKECGELFSSYNLKLIFDENENFMVQKPLDEFSAFQFSISQIADTLQRLIFHKAAIFSNRDTVLLFEEPEAHMFPPYIKKLTADILFDKSNQFFLATHSPYVLDELILEGGEDVAVYLVDYKDGETKVQHLTSEELIEIRQYGVDLFFNIESYLKNGQVNNS